MNLAPPAPLGTPAWAPTGAGASATRGRHGPAGWLGCTVGRYRILEQLGKGGMATVYRARDPSIGRDVALKFLNPELSGDETCRRHFLQEARAAGGLSHPNIVIVHDVGELEGRPYIAMEVCQGGTLADEIGQRGALPLREAVSVALQLARALEHAHRRGIVHRDVKPANVMRDAVTRLFKLADFGIAHVEDAPSALHTRAGDIIGSPPYMSPEQARGEPMDARSDLFSLGIVLYQMVTGERPFRADSLMGMATCIGQQPHVPVERLRGDVPRALRKLLDRCLAKQPADRFQSARELAEALVQVRQELDRGGLAMAWDAVLPPAMRPSRVAGWAAGALGAAGLLVAGAALASLGPGTGEAFWVGATPAAVMALLSIVTLALLAAWTRAVTRPARQLARAMTEVAQGRYAVRLTGAAQGSDEFSALFAAFDEMAQSLQQRSAAPTAQGPVRSVGPIALR